MKTHEIRRRLCAGHSRGRQEEYGTKQQRRNRFGDTLEVKYGALRA